MALGLALAALLPWKRMSNRQHYIWLRIVPILNDSQCGVSPGVVDALEKYDVTPVLWSNRARVVERLAA
jgi:hypothetical protein